MARKQLVASVGWAVALTVALVIGRPTAAQDAPKDPPPAAEKAKDQAKAEKPLRVSLPPYLGKIVDAKQREQIYAILKEFAPKIDELEAKLEALRADREKKIDALLSPEQRKQWADLKEAAKAKRKAARQPKPDKPGKDG